MKTESVVMKIMKKTGFVKSAWSMRRMYCPVDSRALVLEVGSGGNPYYRSNILIDAYHSIEERGGHPIKIDRPAVIGFGEALPFRDNTFDFVIASHVFEHTPYPEAFIAELERVGKAGYIEVPDAIFERLIPYHSHHLQVTLRNNSLVIRKKSSWNPDPELVELYENRLGSLFAGKVIPANPFHFHVRYYWEGKIAYKVVNPEIDADWEEIWTAPSCQPPARSFKAAVKGKILDLARKILSQTSRNRKLDLYSYLICPACKSDSLERGDKLLVCRDCGIEYPVKEGIPIMKADRKKIMRA
ncbi:MAG: methyltransferase domain-containing protein [Spirochaetales bacterium]|nr:methyltransferase domain-containing protein [Spirochaetales bacterium]